MQIRFGTIVIGALVTLVAPLAAQAQTFPGADWQRKTPAEAGINPQLLKDAIDFSIASEIKNPRDLKLNHYRTFGREPFGDAIGPIKDRGDLTGVIIHKGVLVAEWGEPQRVDMTHSVTKSLLSSVVGLAYDGGMIRSVDDVARDTIAPIQLYNPVPAGNRAERMATGDLIDLFGTPHNRTITWNHLLRQTSDWEGTLWGKPDWADRPSDKPGEWLTRPRNQAGTVYKYNDTRTNALALAALNLWRRPLPQVLKEKIMDPIGASNTWRWFGYDNAWVVIDGAPVQSVTGGGHWGGGMFINAYDMARFGYLTLRRGKWGDRQLLSETWVNMALTPTGLQSPYGFINYFLNTDRKQWPSAPGTAFMHNGNGLNMIYVDPENDLVAVVRWIDNNAVDGFLKRLIAAVAEKS